MYLNSPKLESLLKLLSLVEVEAVLVEFLLLKKYKQWDLKINTDITSCKIIRDWDKRYLCKNRNTNYTTLKKFM